MPLPRQYVYVGPSDIKSRVARHQGGTRIDSAADLLAWVRESGQLTGPDGLVGATFVIEAGGNLLVADRHSEHVGCARGGAVLSAGEMFFGTTDDRVEVVEVSNQSTGFCPEPESWPAVATSLDRIGIPHPGRFTTEIVFRRCEGCGERNVVREGWFVCGTCGTTLPAGWNF
jgi:hypothetical protein